MKVIRSIMSMIVAFVLGLEIGGFGAWYLTLSVLSPRREHDERSNYDYHEYNA